MKTVNQLSFVAIFFACCLIACSKPSDNTPTPATPPTLTTNAVTNITFNTATMGGTMISLGSEPIIVRGVCVATNSNPTTLDVSFAASGSGLGTYSVSNVGTVHSFTNATTYHVRAFAQTNSGTTYGNNVVFTTQ